MASSRIVGNKGSDVYSGSGDPRLDLSVKCVRGANSADIIDGIHAIMDMKDHSALVDAFVLAFHTRNVRGGKGERELFYSMLIALHTLAPEMVAKVIDLIPEYGSWADVESMMEASALKDSMQKLFQNALVKDRDTATGKSISLAAKWAPREGKGGAKELAALLFPEVKHHSSRMKNYRKLLSELNKRLNTVETLMCAGKWDVIKPAGVPGRAGKKYNRAFLNLESTYSKEGKIQPTETLRKPDDPVRNACRETFKAHYAAAASGQAKVKGATTLFPHEVVKSAVNLTQTEDEKNHLRAVWKSMVEAAAAGGGLGKSIFMSDFSGSMQCSSAGDVPYWVSFAIGMLGSEVATGAFKNKILTFDSTPKWHTFPEGDLFTRIASIKSTLGQGTSTDFQKAMDLVLETLKKERVKPEDVPESLIVLTDMNWDAACASNGTSAYTGNTYRHVVKTDSWQTHVEMIQEAYRRAGEDMWGVPFVPPRIIIWNLAACAKTDYHATSDTPGVGMLSGWSPTQFAVLQKEGPRQITPYELLRLELDDAKYDPIRARLAQLTRPPSPIEVV
jgi:hypothetical protein